MAEGKDPAFALFELYLLTAEKVSDRRATANSWLLSVNTAIVALYGYLQADKPVVTLSQKAIWLWVIPARRVYRLRRLGSTLKLLSQAKRRQIVVITEMEHGLLAQPFAREREVYTRHDRCHCPYLRLPFLDVFYSCMRSCSLQRSFCGDVIPTSTRLPTL